MKKKTKKNAADTTLRNNRARAKEIEKLEKRVKRLETLMSFLVDERKA